MVTLTETRPEVFVATMTKFLPDYYDYLEDTLTHMNSPKLKIIQGRTLQIAALKYWYTLSALRLPGPSSLIT